nr:phosphatase PAP2/dual specificity phosphatase family protein [Candidatus Accumulibacter aalborgensis]
MLVLGPFFFLSYGFATWVSAQRSAVAYIVFDWEQHVPLLPWTIVPYWLMDVLYGLSLLLCATRRELDTHARRLLVTQLLAVSCFLLFPLRCTFVRGDVGGAFGGLFDLLMSFDQPFNQAPSLHIALLVVLLEPYLRVVPRAWHALVYAAALLIGVSVMTTWQHHFFDIPTGLWLGCFVVWLLPTDAGSPLRRAALSRDPLRRRLAACYAGAAMTLGLLVANAGGAWLYLLWAAGSLFIVALIYLFLDAASFGKRADGSMPGAVCCLLGPYLLGAWLNSRWWTKRLAAADPVAAGILLGRLPSQSDWQRQHVVAIVDLCAELPCPTPGLSHRVVPRLDLVLPTVEQIEEASAAIDEAHQRGAVLVCCALGLARSALAVAAWLLRTGLASSAEDAVAQVQRARPAVVLGAAQVDLLRHWQLVYQAQTVIITTAE